MSTTLLSAPITMAAGLSPSSRDNFERLEDLVLPLEVTAGSCPSQIRLWQEHNPHVPAGESLGIMFDVATLSQGNTEIIDSQPSSVTFRTPLKPAFYSCVATLGDGDLDDHASYYRRLYDIQFDQGHVYFRFDVELDLPASEEDYFFAGIAHQEIIEQHPYVRWVMAD